MHILGGGGGGGWGGGGGGDISIDTVSIERLTNG